MINKKNHFRKFSFLFLCLAFCLSSCSSDDVREVMLYDKGTAEATASATTIEFGETVNFASTSTKVRSLEWTFPGGTPASSTDADVAVRYAIPGTFEAKLEVKYIDNTTDTKTLTIVVNGPDEPLPFSGTAVDLPGTIEAENYDLGGEGVAYHDTEEENKAVTAGSARYRDDDGVDVQVSSDGSLINIGFTNADEWANYTVNVTEAGSYDFDFQVASGGATGGSSIKLQLVNPETGAVTDLGETGDFANTGGWDTYTSAPITGVNLSQGINTLRVYFTGGATNLDKINVNAASTGGGGPTGPLKIAFASNNIAGDAGFITLLENAGHTVEAVLSKYENLDAAGVATLNGFDLVIISRNNNSGAFGSDAGVRANWMAVNTPVLVMSAFIARNSRLQLLDNSSTVNESNGLSLDVTQENHPVFTNVTITGGKTGEISTAALHTLAISNAGNGTLLATATGEVALAEWAANTPFYTGSSTPSSKWMFMTSSGGYTLNDVGDQILLNVVEYIVSGAVGGGESSGPVAGLGFYTERTTTASNPAEIRTPNTIPASNSGNFKLSEVSNAAEGSKAIYANFATTGTGNDVTWGAMVSMFPATLPLDLSAYNHYHISLKAPAENQQNLRLRFRTGSSNYWVTIKTDGKYGFARDGQWHTLKIPFTDMLLDGTGAALGETRSNITEVMFRSDTADAASIGANFDWYIDDIYFTN